MELTAYEVYSNLLITMYGEIVSPIYCCMQLNEQLDHPISLYDYWQYMCKEEKA